MREYRFHKLVGQIVAGVYDDEGNLIGEQAIADVTAYQPTLDAVPDDVRAAMAEINKQANAASEPSAA